MIKLLFSTNNGIGARLIRLGTWSKYSHCDVFTEDGSIIGAVPFKGVIEYDPSIRLKNQYEICVIENVDAAKVIEGVKQQLGKSYDWTGVMSLSIHRDWHSPDKWFCSELLAWAVERAGTPVINKYSNRVTPQDLLESPLVLPLKGRDATL